MPESLRKPLQAPDQSIQAGEAPWLDRILKEIEIRFKRKSNERSEKPNSGHNWQANAN
jgi:hypothetical protein